MWAAQRHKAWDCLWETDLLQGSAGAAVQCSGQQSRYDAPMVLVACREKGRCFCGGYLWWYASDLNCQRVGTQADQPAQCIKETVPGGIYEHLYAC